MKAILRQLTAAAAMLVCSSVSLLADPVTYKAPRARLSPHETISAVVGGGRVVLVYGRPYTTKPGTDQPRTVWGGDLVPLGKIWRTGSDEATLLVLQKPITLGEGESALSLPAGAYTLFTFPECLDHVSLVVSKQVGQWGLQYDPASDLGRVPLQPATLSTPLHQFTMALEKKAPAPA